MSTPTLTAVRLVGPRLDLPLLVVGPSLGTSVATLWEPCALRLAGHFDVVGWDLPGHGTGAPAGGPFTIAELAEAVADMAERVNRERGRPGEAFEYAGDSIGGAVGLQLAIGHPERLLAVTALCTGARIGEPVRWRERAAQVRAQGTASVVSASVGRWFGAGFLDRDPATGAALLNALYDAEDASYAWACEALGTFDLTGRLREISTPVTAVAGDQDTVCPVAGLRLIADSVRDGRLAVLDGVAHLAPAEAPAAVAELIAARPRRVDETLVGGFAVRRAVLGDDYVDATIRARTELTAPFQDFITRYAWGTVWTRPALGRRERSLMTLSALIAGGHLEELALHVRAACTNGLSPSEIAECVLHSAVYCGVPAANSALRVVRRTLEQDDGVEENEGS